jgi:hypothetical protein
MLSLRSFHIFFIALSIVFSSGFGVWGLVNHYLLLGVISLGIGVVLVIYGGYFIQKAQRIHLE